jgi:hypothetical protein
LLEIAGEAGLDMARFRADFESGKARPAVLEEFRAGRERYHVRGTPTLMLPDGTQVDPPLAEPIMRHRKVVAVQPLPCCGEACLEATRALLERAIWIQFRRFLNSPS